ncbi:histidine phosphatase family protein [Mycobacterium sp. ITM-2016-00317]|uniref:histidine phosphatase family protein n=1 Tax=Mycobacterium sp. ITM-2016-00317 TaxID=2099694 RepID=UPI00287F843A|nr:histidine phosphatase family protein [Mycobacterium sp. ITM-2016-00317]WNG85941.1 histidine phosphatase family protein [Mycobacterium sp. ITM-2016-00317]
MSDATTPARHRRGLRTSVMRKSAAAYAVALLFAIGAATPAAATGAMCVTFIRHAESAGNASGLIDTSTPGPALTRAGEQQAQNVASTWGDAHFAGLYASTMVRTQLTAAPLSEKLGLPVQVVDGLQEIEAGVFEHTPERDAAQGYGLYPFAWAVQNRRDLRIPGSINGEEFDARMDSALQTIWDNGDRDPAVFSHGAAIMFWTMMNTDTLTPEAEIDLLTTAPLANTDYVVVEGTPATGWALVNWNGRLFGPESGCGRTG